MKTIIMAFPLNSNPAPTVYQSTDKLLPSSEKAYRFPIAAYLEKNTEQDDEFLLISVFKRAKGELLEKEIGLFNELKQLLSSIVEEQGATIAFEEVYSQYAQGGNIYSNLMKAIVEKIEDEVHLVADITYGTKDIPITIMSVLQFAERLLHCTIDHVIYGDLDYNRPRNEEPKKGFLCDVTTLFALSSLASTTYCKTSEQARIMLESWVNI